MRSVRLVSLVVAVLVAVPLAARAHPLGNFTTNQYLGLAITPSVIEVDYVVDMAEIPAFQERQVIDSDDDDIVSRAEQAAYVAAACSDRAAGLGLIIDGTALTLNSEGSSLSFPAGQAGLTTLRLECSYNARGTGRSLFVENHNYPDRIGWREIVVTSAGLQISSDLPAESASGRLTAYPRDLAASLDIRSGSVSLSGGGNANAPAAVASAPTTGLPVDALGSLIARVDLDGGAALLALAAAAALGAGHALAPGHGKTVIAAYLVAKRGTLRQALGLGLAVAVSHTVGVLALGLATLFATRSFRPERVFPYLSAVSGLIVVGIGIGLTLRTRGRWRHARAHAEATHQHHGHPHDHHHHYPNRHPAGRGPSLGWKGLTAVGLIGGLVPSASAVVLLLGAVHLGRIEFGLALVGAFGLGMAAAMVVVGVGLLFATRFGMKRLGETAWSRRLTVATPAVMGAMVTVVGLFMVANAGQTLFAS